MPIGKTFLSREARNGLPLSFPSSSSSEAVEGEGGDFREENGGSWTALKSWLGWSVFRNIIGSDFRIRVVDMNQ